MDEIVGQEIVCGTITADYIAAGSIDIVRIHRNGVVVSYWTDNKHFSGFEQHPWCLACPGQEQIAALHTEAAAAKRMPWLTRTPHESTNEPDSQ